MEQAQRAVEESEVTLAVAQKEKQQADEGGQGYADRLKAHDTYGKLTKEHSAKVSALTAAIQARDAALSTVEGMLFVAFFKYIIIFCFSSLPNTNSTFSLSVNSIITVAQGYETTALEAKEAAATALYEAEGLVSKATAARVEATNVLATKQTSLENAATAALELVDQLSSGSLSTSPATTTAATTQQVAAA